MNKENLNQLFRQADTELSTAQNQLYKPSHDVVTYSVCVNARSALYRFLQCMYLLYADDKSKPVDDSVTLIELLEFSRQYDDGLKRIDFSKMNCLNRDVRQEKGDEFYFCDDTCTVRECADAAASVRKLVIEKAGEIIKSG
ncbi:MAG: hypothetical protein EA364_14165 [Balneolaceae bacterium]|nr:MAG: hypothetical protein EA364_14165 [Balneolaceae bacterium]